MSTVMLAPCGTYGAYQRHVRRGEEPCEPCKNANAAYMRALRGNSGFYARDLARNSARGRALTRLAQEYPRRYQELFAEESAGLYTAGEPS